MKNKLVFCLAAAAALALASCTQEETVHHPSGAIAFRSSTGFTPARGAVTALANTGHFHCYAFSDDASFTPYFSNVTFTKEAPNSNVFKSAENYYWPGTGGLKFYAVTDIAATESDPNLNKVGSDVQLQGFKPAANIADQKDVTAATVQGNKNSTSLELKFVHTLSQIEIKAHKGSWPYTVKVKGVKLNGFCTNGTYTFPTGVSEADATLTPAKVGAWGALASASAEKAKYVLNFNEITLGANPVSLTNDNNAFVIPQTLTKWNRPKNDPTIIDKINNTAGFTGDDSHQSGSYIGVLVQVSDANGVVFPASKSGYLWVAVPFDYAFEAGKKYIVTLDFSKGVGLMDPEYDDDDAPGGGTKPSIGDGDEDGDNTGDKKLDGGDLAMGLPIEFTVTVEGWTPITGTLNTTMQ